MRAKWGHHLWSVAARRSISRGVRRVRACRPADGFLATNSLVVASPPPSLFGYLLRCLDRYDVKNWLDIRLVLGLHQDLADADPLCGVFCLHGPARNPQRSILESKFGERTGCGAGRGLPESALAGTVVGGGDTKSWRS